MITNPYDYPVIGIRRVVDGDTVDLVLEKDIGFYIKAQATVRLRLLNVDTPERGHAQWDDAREYTLAWLEHHVAQGTARASTHKTDNFGRWLAYVYAPRSDGTVYSLNEDLIAAGLGEEYRR